MIIFDILGNTLDTKNIIEMSLSFRATYIQRNGKMFVGSSLCFVVVLFRY